jgi:hypothetical protein
MLLNFAFPPPSAPLRLDESIGGFRRALFEHVTAQRVVRVAQPPDGFIQPKEAEGWRGGAAFLGLLSLAGQRK